MQNNILYTVLGKQRGRQTSDIRAGNTTHYSSLKGKINRTNYCHLKMDLKYNSTCNQKKCHFKNGHNTNAYRTNKEQILFIMHTHLDFIG